MDIEGIGYTGRILRKDLISAIKSFISPEAFREADFRVIRRF